MQFRYANIVSSNHIVTSTSSPRTQPRSSSDDPGPGDVATGAEAYIDNVFIGGIDGDVDVVNPPTLQEDLSDIIFVSAGRSEVIASYMIFCWEYPILMMTFIGRASQCF
jgi:hypothetical protein